MKATRLKQDLDRLHEAADRAAALDAVSKRLQRLQDDGAKLKPATPAARAKADAARAMLKVVGAKLTTVRAGGSKQEDAAEEDF